jgi:hypothetical protein
MEVSGYGLLKVLSQNLFGGPEETNENFSQDSQYLDQDLKLGPLTYKAGVLTIQPQHLLTVTKKFNSEMRGTTNQVYQI